ncbi:MAG: DegT/DnrJ/EryC1/StrS family aminotransferase [Candidatus Bathyarchaeota archaeon]
MKIPLAKPIFDEEMQHAATEALQNEHFVLGESVLKFEEEFARFCGAKYAVSTSSGTSALQISLLALGVSQGDHVITSPFSFIATANSVLHANAVPMFADIDTGNYNVDPKLVEKKITKRVKAVIPVHLYGFPADMNSILEISQKFGLAVVEDACQAHGAEYFGQRVGGIGDVGCFSFYPSKNMTVCGDGGMIVTNTEKVAKAARKLRDCGRVSHYEHDVIGFTSRLNTVNAAVGRVQLRKLDSWNEKRRDVAKLYGRLLSDLDEMVLPPQGGSDIKPVYHLYVIRTGLRDELKSWLGDCGVQCGVHYSIPIHLQPIYRQLFGYKKGDFPQSELLSKTTLSLPMFPELKKQEIEYICEKIHQFFEKRG